MVSRPSIQSERTANKTTKWVLVWYGEFVVCADATDKHKPMRSIDVKDALKFNSEIDALAWLYAKFQQRASSAVIYAKQIETPSSMRDTIPIPLGQLPMSDAPTLIDTRGPFRVEEIYSRVRKYLTTATLEVITNQSQNYGQNNVYSFGRVVAEDTEEALRDWASRLNDLISIINNKPHLYRMKRVRPRATAALTMPLGMPLTSMRADVAATGKYVYVVYLMVEGDGVPRGEEGRVWLNTLVGRRMKAFVEGSIPEVEDE